MTRSDRAPIPLRRCRRFATGGFFIPFRIVIALVLAGAAEPSLAAEAATSAELDDADTQPPRYDAPFTDGVAGADAWVEFEEILGDTLHESPWWNGSLFLDPLIDIADPRPVRLIPSGSRPVPQIPEIPMRLSRTGVGVYAGYPSAVGALVSAPVDGPLGARFGLAAFPGVGVAWSPGFELRFGQERGTYSSDGYHAYANLLLGRTYVGADKERTSMEAGLGYRWVVSDRQGLRWLAAAEFGGRWTRDSGWPDRPGLRVYWLYADW